jgi:hypothetical protein
MELHKVKKRTAEPKNIECRMSKDGIASLSHFFKIDRSTQKLTTGRIHSFDIRHSSFDIRFFKVSFSIRLTAFQANGGTEPLNPERS